MFQGSTSIAIEGARRATSRGAERHAEIAKCRPGEVLELRRERHRVRGARAVGVYSPRGVQIGYVSSPDADHIAGQVAVARAVFQRSDTFGAVISLTLDGTTPTLPQPKPDRPRGRPAPDPVDEFCDIFPARVAHQRRPEL